MLFQVDIYSEVFAERMCHSLTCLLLADSLLLLNNHKVDNLLYDIILINIIYR